MCLCVQEEGGKLKFTIVVGRLTAIWPQKSLFWYTQKATPFHYGVWWKMYPAPHLFSAQMTKYGISLFFPISSCRLSPSLRPLTLNSNFCLAISEFRTCGYVSFLFKFHYLLHSNWRHGLLDFIFYFLAYLTEEACRWQQFMFTCLSPYLMVTIV